MGKQKRQRQKPHKKNPTGLPSVQEFELNEELTKGNREKILQNVYDDVNNDEVSQQYAICILFFNQIKSIKLIRFKYIMKTISLYTYPSLFRYSHVISRKNCLPYKYWHQCLATFLWPNKLLRMG